MSVLREARSRPAGDGTATQESNAGQASPDYRAAAPNGTPATLTGYAVVVTVPGDPEPRTRRRVLMSLHAATRAVERAEARGLDAHLVLVRLIPEGVSAP